MIRHHHSLLSEAIDAGFIGGITVAAWFFLRDLVGGRPLATPSLLGQLFLLGEAHPVPRFDFGAVILYTGAHFVLFVLFGLVLAVMVRLAVQQPLMRFALLMLCVAFELFFYVLINAISVEVGAFFPLWSVASANLLALGAMGWYFWRKHPALRRALTREPLGA
ncbi:MAG TPA: hypothetical protein VLT17_02130 [Gemmatimonadales bacterium]|jgi:hypothetical protein|nr:hypothetical protein [Gemmatimonadales bacterium]